MTAFTHTPRPARVINGQPDALHTFGNTGGHIRVVRHGDAPVIETQMRLFTGDRHAAITDNLTADEAEELGRALLDAAHDLRSRVGRRFVRRTSQGVPA